MSNGYNGWKNYETWLVNLWWTNDEPSYNEARRLMGGMTRDELDDGTAASAIKDATEEMCPALGEGGFQADLIGSALSEVYWQEIAEAWAEDFGLDEEEEEEEETEEV